MTPEDYSAELVMWIFRLLPVAALVVAASGVVGLRVAIRMRCRAGRIGVMAGTLILAVPVGLAISLLAWNLTKPS